MTAHSQPLWQPPTIAPLDDALLPVMRARIDGKRRDRLAGSRTSLPNSA
jgi:hypothetical protein